jgi:hypothetical protein
MNIGKGVMKTIVAMVVATCFTVNVEPASTGFFDNLKQKAEEAVEDTVDQLGKNDHSSQEPPAPAKTQVSASTSKTAPANASVADNSWKKTPTFADDAARGIVLAEAPAGGASVLDMPLRDIRLGMPARIADRILTDEGFGYRSYGDIYVMEVRNINGQIGNYRQEDLRGKSVEEQGKLVKRYMIKFLSTPVSSEFIDELDADRKAMVAEATATYEKEKAEQQAAAQNRNRDRELHRRDSSQSTARFTGQPVSLIYYIEYTQIIGPDQGFDYQKALAKAKEVFGGPNYHASTHVRAGAAYQTSDKNNLIYADVLLASASEKEAMVKQAVPKYHYVMKQGMSHPCSGVMRGKCPNGASPAHAFPGNLEMQLKLARLQGAPFMLVSPQTSSGMKIVQEWQYLLGGDSIRKAFMSQKKQSTKPEASVDF